MWRNSCPSRGQGTSAGQTETGRLWRLLQERGFTPLPPQIDKLPDNVLLQLLNGHQQVASMSLAAPPSTLALTSSVSPSFLSKELVGRYPPPDGDLPPSSVFQQTLLLTPRPSPRLMTGTRSPLLWIPGPKSQCWIHRLPLWAVLEAILYFRR